MRTLKLKLDLEKLKLNEADQRFFQEQGIVGAIESVFTAALSRKYREGLEAPMQRILFRIQTALDNLDKSGGDLFLEEAEYQLFKDAFCSDGVRFLPDQVRMIMQIKNIIEHASNEDFK